MVLGNGFDLAAYGFCAEPEPLLGWAGRVAPEKGLEDAAAAAAQLGLPLAVWGLVEDRAYAAAVEASVPAGTLQWRGFLPTDQLQEQLGRCRALLNTPKWNEAYGNVVVEALACGVPVVAYRRGGPGELVQPGLNGLLVEPDDVGGLVAAVAQVGAIDRRACRQWAHANASREVLAERVEAWLLAGFGLLKRFPCRLKRRSGFLGHAAGEHAGGQNPPLAAGGGGSSRGTVCDLQGRPADGACHLPQRSRCCCGAAAAPGPAGRPLPGARRL